MHFSSVQDRIGQREKGGYLVTMSRRRRAITLLRLAMGFRLLTLVRPFLSVLPDVQRADRRVPFKEKAIYTAVALFVFLVCSQLPLYGIKTNAGSDPFYWARVIMASNRGTCMELGISPIVTSGLVMQLLAGSKIIDVDNSVKADRDLLCALSLAWPPSPAVTSDATWSSLPSFLPEQTTLGYEHRAGGAFHTSAAYRIPTCRPCICLCQVT